MGLLIVKLSDCFTKVEDPLPCCLGNLPSYPAAKFTATGDFIPSTTFDVSERITELNVGGDIIQVEYQLFDVFFILESGYKQPPS